MTSILELDNPWRRLPWSLPLAIAICTAVLLELGHMLERPPAPSGVPLSIEAELVEVPPPEPKTVKQPSPARQKPVARPPDAEKKPISPARQPVDAAPPAPVTLPEAPAASTERGPAPVSPSPAPPKTAMPSAVDGKSAGSSTMGAQAIVRPLPKIPDDLLDEAFSAVAIARFHVAADGSATFELARATPNPRLNRLLLEKLKEWRFFPATRDGKPVSSVQDVRITFEVK